ncbi:hypothetical protein VTN77DRAFT_1493 [Rasamsonia byssochlamydoides]|uniref:uncharacterized protein n=1 Tax=Rasamsonia byssochlamydoides TaxID=89139 RepID=UPI003743BD90
MRQRKKAVACVRCRQMKLGCDAPQRFPSSCSRCQRKGLHCSVDPSFKRVAKRERLDALEKELKEIKQRLRSTSETNNQRSVEVSRPATPSPEVDVFQPAQAVTESSNLESPKAMGGVELDSTTISDLFKEYYLHYHEKFPILPESSVVLDNYDACPLLFWTVMMIASKESPQHKHLFPAVTGVVTSLASIISPPAEQSLHLIQALLLLCNWPPPYGATIHDNSWTYCGLAVTYALRQGLHRPHHVSDFVYEAEFDVTTMRERKRTWLACFIVSQRASILHGLPSLLRADHSILETLTSKPSWLPDALYHQLQIAHLSGKFCNILGNHELTSTGLLPNPASLIQMFDVELQTHEAQLAQKWSRGDYMFFLATRLHLYAFALTDPAVTDADGGLAGGLHSEFLAHAYLAAMSLLQSAVDSPTGLRYWSMYQGRDAVNAAFFLLKLVGGNHEFVDHAQARNMIHKFWELLREQSRVEDDHIARLCAIIEYLSRSSSRGNQEDRDQLSLRVRSRMTANLIIDAVWRARDRFSQSVKAQRPKDYTSAAAVERAMTELDNQILSPLDGAGDWTSFFEGLNSNMPDLGMGA